MKTRGKRFELARQKLTEWLRRLRLAPRLYVAGIIVGLVPLLVVSLVSYFAGSRSILDKVSRSDTQTIEQVASVVGTNLQIIINDGIEIAYSDIVQSSLPRYSSMSAMEKNALFQSLSESINKKYIFNNYDGEITLYTLNEERINAYGPVTFFFTPKQVKLDELITRLKALSGKPLWLSVDASYEQRLANYVIMNRNSIVMARAIKSLDTGDLIGYMTIRLGENEIAKLYKDLSINNSASLFILNSEGTVISTADAGLTLAKPYADPSLLENIRHADGRPFRYRTGGVDYLAVYSPIKQADWYTVALIPTQLLFADSQSLLRSILLTSVLCGVMALLFYVLISGSIVRPIRSLNRAMDAFSRNLDSRPVKEDGRDEITAISRRFNKMTQEITELVGNIHEQEKQKRELEIRALQAQINPHFFANALNTAAYMAQVKGEKNIEEMIRSIIALLNGCMKNDTTMSSVREAIDFMKSYATAQEYRMMGRFHIQYQVEPEIEDCLIPRFILQPIVENALIHGIEPTGRAGLVVVKGYRQEDRLYFTVTDNGKGMSQEQIERLTREPEENGGHRMTGIGIYNVQSRLRLLYGAPYGLTITSVEGVFTAVEIVMPVCEGAGVD